MRRSLQEYVELVVFGLIAVLVGTGLLWVVGWVLSLGGLVLKGLAGLLWMLLRFIVPVAIAGGLVYFLVKAAQGRQRHQAGAGTGASSTGASLNPSYTPPINEVKGGVPAASGAAGTVGVTHAASPSYDANGTVTSGADRAAGEVVADFDEASPGVGADPLAGAADTLGDTSSDALHDPLLDPTSEADEALDDERDEA